MSDVIVIKGAVQFSITLDPTVWIFDERKINLDTYVEMDTNTGGKDSAYIQGTGSQWDKELREGAPLPTEQRSLADEKKVLDGGNYGMKLGPFLDNASPLQDAKHVVFIYGEGQTITVPLEEAKEAILQFAKDGKPIGAEGPALLYLPRHWREKLEPIKGLTMIEVTT